MQSTRNYDILRNACTIIINKLAVVGDQSNYLKWKKFNLRLIVSAVVINK